MIPTVGIATSFRGIRYRSRLEARWAAFFDNIGWRHEYEPLDLDGYIPDFVILGDAPLVVEVGACVTRHDYIDKAEKADRHAAKLGRDVLIVGISPLPDIEIRGSGELAAGWLGEYFDGRYPAGDGHPPAYSWETGVWADGELGLGIFHSVQGYGHRPHADGHEGVLSTRVPVEVAWAEAVNGTQWRRRP